MWMTLKAGGFALVATAGYMVGQTVASSYARRPDDLKQCQAALGLLSSEVEYATTHLGVALQRVGRSLGGQVGDAFCRAAAALAGPANGTVEAWEEGLGWLQTTTALSRADIEILRTLGLRLGATDRADQLRHLAVAVERLKVQEELARQARDRNETVWRYLGALGGLALGLILL